METNLVLIGSYITKLTLFFKKINELKCIILFKYKINSYILLVKGN